MARVSMRIVSWRAGRVIDAIDGQMARRMRKATEILAGSVKRSMKGGGSPHQPSAPGQPPRVDTSAYRARIYTDVKVRPRRVTGKVISPSAQARALEFGYAPGNLAPRPHLRPALSRERIRIFRALTGSSRKGVPTLREIRTLGGSGISTSVSGSTGGGL